MLSWENSLSPLLAVASSSLTVNIFVVRINTVVRCTVCALYAQISSIHAIALPSFSSPSFRDMKDARFSASTTPDKQTQVLLSFHNLQDYQLIVLL